ncbi:hypothetical protein D3C83_110630 [compost metagenome]
MAKAHITPSATIMLTIWPVARAALALDALNRVSSPTVMSVSMNTSSTPSTWRVR